MNYPFQLNEWPHIGPGFCTWNKTNVKSCYRFWYKNCFLVKSKTKNSLNLYFSFYDLKSYKCNKSAALPTGLPLILPNLIGVVSTMPWWWCYKVYLSESPFLILTSCQYLLFTETDDSDSPTQWHFCYNSFQFFFLNSLVCTSFKLTRVARISKEQKMCDKFDSV